MSEAAQNAGLLTQRSVRVGGFLLKGALALGVSTLALSASLAQEIIDNGTIQLGINPFGELIVGGEGGGIGLTFLPTGGEALAPGCFCEGWGVADFGVGTGFGRSQSNGNSGTGTSTIVVSGAGTDGASTGSSAIVTTDITEGGNPWARVIHSFGVSASANLYQVDVTITNLGGVPIADLRYRRAMDWDVPPTEFSEFVTLQGWPATALVGSSDDGFANPNPNSGALGDTGGAPVDGNFADNGPADHGAAFDFSFGNLAAGASKSFKIFYGAAVSITQALAELGKVGAEVYSLGYPSDESVDGAPNVFIFAFAGVGGIPVGGAAGGFDPELLRSMGRLYSLFIFDDPLLKISGFVNGGEVLGGSERLPGLRFILNGGYSGTRFDTQVGDQAKVNTGHAGVTADYAFDVSGQGLESARAGLGFDFGWGRGSLESGADVDAAFKTLYAYSGANLSGGAYVDGILGYSWVNYDTLRAPGAGDFAGSTDGGQFMAMIRGGVDRPVNTGGRLPGELSLGAFGVLQYVNSSIDGFTESSVLLPGGAVTLGDQDASGVTARLGVRANYATKLDNGMMVASSLWAAWEHQTHSGDTISVATGAGAPADLDLASFSRNVGRIGTRVGVQMNDKLTVSGEYEGAFGSDSFQQHTVTARLKVSF
jgi:hypothetical protein